MASSGGPLHVAPLQTQASSGSSLPGLLTVPSPSGAGHGLVISPSARSPGAASLQGGLLRRERSNLSGYGPALRKETSYASTAASKVGGWGPAPAGWGV